jgi:hypothetical protein
MLHVKLLIANANTRRGTPYSHLMVVSVVLFTLKCEQEIVLEGCVNNTESQGKTALPRGISPEESARYSIQLIDSLRKLALGQNHHRLAKLLAEAEIEAETLAAHPAGHKTA